MFKIKELETLNLDSRAIEFLRSGQSVENVVDGEFSSDFINEFNTFADFINNNVVEDWMLDVLMFSQYFDVRMAVVNSNHKPELFMTDDEEPIRYEAYKIILGNKDIKDIDRKRIIRKGLKESCPYSMIPELCCYYYGKLKLNK